MELIDASTTKVSITRFFELHISHQKSKRLKAHSSELCRDMCFAIDAQQTIDAVPRQKYEDDMENAFAHGYTDAESNFRKMIADGELVEVVRCRDCKHYTWADNRAFGFPVKRCEWTGFEDVGNDDFCSRGERRKR